MVWTYHSVEQLREKYNQGGEITAAEKRKLEKYIRQKKKVAGQARDSWDLTQLRRAEFLFHKIQQDQKIEVETQQ